MRFFIVTKNGELVRNHNNGFLWAEQILRDELKRHPPSFIGADIREVGFTWHREGGEIRPPVHQDYGTRLLAQAVDLLSSLPQGERAEECATFKSKVVRWLLGSH